MILDHQFFISLEDDLMRIFGAKSIDGMLKKLGLKQGESINHPWINKAMERAQQKVESRNFEIRKTLLKFDSVMNDQRQVIFGQRLEIMKSKDISSMINSFFNEVVKNSIDILGKFKNDNDIKSFSSGMRSYYGNVFNDKEIESFSMKTLIVLKKKLIDSFKKRRRNVLRFLGKKKMTKLKKDIFTTFRFFMEDLIYNT